MVTKKWLKWKKILYSYSTCPVCKMTCFNHSGNRVGKIPAFMSKVHAGGIYRRLLVFTGIYWNLPAFTDIAGFCYYSLY